MTEVWIKYYKEGSLQETLTFEEAEAKSDKLRQELELSGVKEGDRLLVQLPNSIEAAITYLALRKLGAVAVPINTQEAESRVEFIIENCFPRGRITSKGVNLYKKEIADTEYVRKYRGQISTIIYTSGTTGNPKGVCLSRKNWEANAKSLIKHHNLTPLTVVATPLPLFHCNAHGFGMYSTFFVKSKLILFDKVPENFLEVLGREKVNVASVVPAILHKLFNENTGWSPHKEFGYFLTAAAPLSGDLLRSIIDTWGVKVIQGYGLTESTNFSCTVPADLNELLYEKIMFPHPSLGVAIPDVTVKIDSEREEEDELGQVLIESPANSMGYWGHPLEGVKVVETGDLGYFKEFDGKRFYYLKGRLKELINRGGEKLYPLDLEKELRSIGLQDEIYIFSIRNEKFGEEVGLAALKPFDFSILVKVPTYRRPKVVYLVDKFFFTPTGKIQRRLLSEYCADSKSGAKAIWKDGKKESPE